MAAPTATFGGSVEEADVLCKGGSRLVGVVSAGLNRSKQ